ncbi:MAG: TetR family transcriptional regulator C-terminal domain-containing protein [Geminicoccaceae bacterium]
MTAAAPRLRLRHDERRDRLVAGTLACLARHGAKGAGVRQLCRDLGVAPSLVAHFFAGWSDLLQAAYDALAERYLHGLHEAATRPASPRDRLQAMIAWTLSPEELADETIGAYVALWALSRTDVDLKARFAGFHATRRALFAPAIGALAAERGVTVDADAIAASLVVVLDGFWLDLGLSPGTIPTEDAQAMALAWVDMHLSKSHP